jgi:DNA polymerase-3 subunit delta'
VIDQIRDLMGEIHLKPNEAEYKVAVIAGADRLNLQAANAFLKTLEEPPPKSVIILLTIGPQQLLDTILSRCLRLNFAGDGSRKFSEDQRTWVAQFSEVAMAERGGMLGRYRLLGSLLQHLGGVREQVEKQFAERSPLSRHEDIEPETRKRWEEELDAAVEAEYRRLRADLLVSLQWWCRDVWLHTLQAGDGLLEFPEMPGASQLAQRLSTPQALSNLGILERTQRLLNTNVQEALALEVGLLQLNL